MIGPVKPQLIGESCHPETRCGDCECRNGAHSLGAIERQSRGVVKENQQWADIDSVRPRAEPERETTGFWLEKLCLVS